MLNSRTHFPFENDTHYGLPRSSEFSVAGGVWVGVYPRVADKIGNVFSKWSRKYATQGIQFPISK